MNVFSNAARLLSDGESVVLAVTIDRSGSAPRTVGSRMIIRSNGSILGTIGGGILEARVREPAAELFRTRGTLVRKYALTTKDVSQMEMICGGEVRVLIQFVDASEPSQVRFYQDISASLTSHRQALLITRIPGEEGDFERPDCGLMEKDGRICGTIAPEKVRYVAARFTGRQSSTVQVDRENFLVEPLCVEGTVYIFGAGHISRELAPLVKLVGFRTIVLDDREEFACRSRFPNADSVQVIDSFDRPPDGIEIDEDSYLVIVTRAHAHDKTVLGWAPATKAGYIGMIGSRRKRDIIYKTLIMEGMPRADLDRVHCPIGLDIGAETPEEIAVSIAAELIQARAARNK